MTKSPRTSQSVVGTPLDGRTLGAPQIAFAVPPSGVGQVVTGVGELATLEQDPPELAAGVRRGPAALLAAGQGRSHQVLGLVERSGPSRVDRQGNSASGHDGQAAGCEGPVAAARPAASVPAAASLRLGQRLHPGPAEDLHAAVVIGQGNRDWRERLCRYVLRPPLAKTRRERRGDGVWTLTLRRPYANGTTRFIYSEFELMEKLAALAPPAEKNGVSCHGVFGPWHRLRTAVSSMTPGSRYWRG